MNYSNNKEEIILYIKRLKNRIFKLLPLREEDGFWQDTILGILVDIKGFQQIVAEDYKDILLLPLECKLKGMTKLVDEEDFALYRRSIFDALSILEQIQEEITNG